MTDQWISLDFRHLTALRAIADEGSFKGAARALGYTPSAISQQIAGLERVIGARVIAREHGRQAVGVTEPGRILLRHMNAIEARLNAAKSEIDALTEGTSGPLRLGVYESVGARLLPEVVGRYRDLFPRVRVEVDEALSDLDLLRQVERGLLDLAFTLLPLPPGPFDSKLVLRDPWVLVAQTGSEHAALRSGCLTLRTVGELPLVSFRAPRAIDSVLDQFRAVGIEPRLVLQSDYNDAVQELAAAGAGVALMPRLAVNPHDERTTTVELGDLLSPREVAVAWHSERMVSEAFSTFTSLAAEVGASVEAVGADGSEWRRSAVS
ncbi:MAG: LysR family transcriptional regulator [Actinobacteria bacterium]|nr:LysR family transcriptional regulator [Actinomycetota bacterium]